MTSWSPDSNRGAYDFEAWNWVNPRACGLLWGPPGERNWDYHVDAKSKRPQEIAPKVLRSMLSIAKSGGPFDWWAHNGGRYDVSFLLDAVIRLGWSATGHVAAGRVVVLYLKAPGEKKPLRLYDSQALVPSALKSAAVDFDLQSRKLLGEDDYSLDVRRWSLKRLQDGCRADCEVVLELLDKVETLLEDWGGGLRATFSSAALSVVEANVEDLPDMRDWSLLNGMARLGYAGGRVEVLHHDPQEKLCELDVCSSYPWSMTQPLPFEPRGVAESAKELAQLFEIGHGVVRARVKVPKTQWLPPLPFLHEKGGVFFPTGEWQGWFQAEELRYAVGVGCEVRPLEGICYEVAQPFADYVEKLYRVKAEAKGALRTFAKLLLNGSYGKFAMKPERENLKIFATVAEAREFYMRQPDDTVRMLSDDERFLAVLTERWSRRTHYALAGAITAHSRMLLHNFLTRAVRPAYCDTDSVHAATPTLKSLRNAMGEGLGQLKTEIPEMTARYYAPKIYVLHPTGGEPHYASKGFPVSAEDFKKVIAGESVQFEKMRLAKRQLRLGGEVARDTQTRRWGGRSMKRRPNSDGSTTPWNVDDLKADLHLNAISPIFKKSGK